MAISDTLYSIRNEGTSNLNESVETDEVDTLFEIKSMLEDTKAMIESGDKRDIVTSLGESIEQIQEKYSQLTEKTKYPHAVEVTEDYIEDNNSSLKKFRSIMDNKLSYRSRESRNLDKYVEEIIDKQFSGKEQDYVKMVFKLSGLS